MLEGGRKSTKNGLAMGVKIGGDDSKSGRNNNLLVIMRVGLSQKIGLLKLANQNQFKKKTAKNYVQKVCAITG